MSTTSAPFGILLKRYPIVNAPSGSLARKAPSETRPQSDATKYLFLGIVYPSPSFLLFRRPRWTNSTNRSVMQVSPSVEAPRSFSDVSSSFLLSGNRKACPRNPLGTWSRLRTLPFSFNLVRYHCWNHSIAPVSLFFSRPRTALYFPLSCPRCYATPPCTFLMFTIRTRYRLLHLSSSIPCLCVFSKYPYLAELNAS